MGAVQGTFLDLDLDLDLDAGDRVALGRLSEGVEHVDLGRGAWLDLRRSFCSGASGLLERLVAAVPWREERRRMYERMVDVPRLLAFYEAHSELPDAALSSMRAAVVDHYGSCSGGPVATVGLCLYRDGRDSVAWHGDRIGRGATEDTLVAIVSLGATRRFLVRPRGGGPTRRFELASGDLLVMGGSCQRTFEHAVPKTARPVGPRCSIQLRPAGVR